MAVDRSDFIFLSGLIAAGLTVIAGCTAIPAFGLMGAVWARVAIQVLAVAFGGWFVFSRLGFPLPFRALAKLLLAAGLCGAAARLCLLVPGPASLPVAILAGAAAYMISIRLLHALPAGDIERLRTILQPLPAGLRTAADLGLRILTGGADGGHPSPAGALAAKSNQPQPLAAATGAPGRRNAN
jgi:hypothetical protein